jgi:hypothetical protein
MVKSSGTVGKTLVREIVHGIALHWIPKLNPIVSLPAPTAGQSPVAGFMFAALIASRSLHLPGSADSSLLVTVIVVA